MGAIRGSKMAAWRRGAALSCALLLLVPLVCAAIAMAVPAPPATTSPQHHGSASAAEHPLHQAPHRHDASLAAHHAGSHHGHGCCVLAARKPAREDPRRWLGGAAADLIGTPAAPFVDATSARRASTAVHPFGPPGPAGRALPLRL